MYNKVLTKRNTLFFGLIGLTISLIDVFYFSFCAHYTTCDKYFDPIHFVAQLLIIALPTLLISLLTYKMREEVFRAWMIFAIWWVPLTILLTLAGSSQQSQSLPFPSEKGIIDIGMTLVFTIVSVIIILMKRSSLKS